MKKTSFLCCFLKSITLKQFELQSINQSALPIIPLDIDSYAYTFLIGGTACLKRAIYLVFQRLKFPLGLRTLFKIL